MQWTLIEAAKKEEWNRFVAGSREGSFAQSYEWGVVKSETWIPYYTAVVDSTGTILAAGLVLKRKLPMGVFCLLYCPRGPVFREYTRELLDFYFQGLEHFAKKHRAIWFRCDPEIHEQDVARKTLLTANRLKPIQENIQPRATIILDIQATENELLSSFHHKTRYNIRLAEKKGVTIHQADDRKGVDVFYELFRTTAERDRFMIMKKSYFYRLWDVLYSEKMCALFIASHEGEPLGAIFQVIFGDTMTYLYGASSNAKRHVMPNQLLHWRAIQWAKSQGISKYDFWGIPYLPEESHPLWGVYRFKKGFCDEEARWIGAYEQVYFPVLQRCFHVSAKIFKSTVRFFRTGTFRAPLGD